MRSTCSSTCGSVINSNMKELEKEIREYLAERKWDQLRPGDLAKSIAIEAGELLEVFQWDNPSLAEVKGNPERLAEIKKEHRQQGIS